MTAETSSGSSDKAPRAGSTWVACTTRHNKLPIKVVACNGHSVTVEQDGRMVSRSHRGQRYSVPLERFLKLNRPIRA